MDFGISAAGAFIGGVISIAAPCSAALLPAFFAYAVASRKQIVFRTMLFLLGLLTTLVPLGAFAGSLGTLLISQRVLFVRLSAVLIIVLGVVQAFGLASWLSKPFQGLFRGRADGKQPGGKIMITPTQVAKTHKRVVRAGSLGSLPEVLPATSLGTSGDYGSSNQRINHEITADSNASVFAKDAGKIRANSGSPSSVANLISIYLLGTVFGISSVCSGPILGSVLTVAAIGANVFYGMYLLALYAFGMTLPVLIIALLWDWANIGEKSWMKPRLVRLGTLQTTVGNLVGGAIFVFLGIYLWLTGGAPEGFGFLSDDAYLSLEQSVKSATANVSDYAPLIVVVLVLLVIVLLALRNRRKKANKISEQDI